MKRTILIDMNLTPDWVNVLQAAGWSAVHWSSVGATTASDQEIMDYARSAGQIVMTQDLDFTVLLALTHAVGPSVVQIRARDSRPRRIQKDVISAINQHATELEQGAIVVVDEFQARVRVLPL
jgi:predicted nuclease of predicted toxin-antitoxin system